MSIAKPQLIRLDEVPIARVSSPLRAGSLSDGRFTVRPAETCPSEGQVGLVAEINPGPPQHPSLFAYTSAYQTRIKFKTFHNVAFDFGYPANYANWERLANEVKESTENTELWDNQWYFTTIDVNKFIVMIAVDLDNGQWHGAAIVNLPDRWNAKATGRWPDDPQRIRNGYNNRITGWSRTLGGSTFDFDLWNPDDDNVNTMYLSWGR